MVFVDHVEDDEGGIDSVMFWIAARDRDDDSDDDVDGHGDKIGLLANDWCSVTNNQTNDSRLAETRCMVPYSELKLCSPCSRQP